MNHDTMKLSTDCIADIRELVESARKPFWLKRPGEDVHDLVDALGDLAGREALRPARVTCAMSFRGFCDQVNEYHDPAVEDETRIFVNDHAVEAVFDDGLDRRDRIRFPLNRCDSYEWILKAERGASLSQRELEWLLRTDFSGRFGPETLLPTVRRLRFKRNESGESNIEHGRESMGKSIETEVAGVDPADMPESVVLQTSVFKELIELADSPVFSVECAFRVNVDEGTFTLRPIEGEIQRAMRDAQNAVEGEIHSGIGQHEGVTIFPRSSDTPS